MDYSKDFLASLGSSAGGGKLDATQIGHLKGCPTNEPYYTTAMALLAAHYEAKRDYKSHCEIAKGVTAQGRYKYNPEWTLETAKCALRNGQLDTAISQADTTISYQSDLGSRNRAARVLLAYQIKARANTAKFDNDAKANAGFGNDQLLNRAASSWQEVRNYAQGVGNSRAVEQAQREVDDLDARRAPTQ